MCAYERALPIFLHRPSRSSVGIWNPAFVRAGYDYTHVPLLDSLGAVPMLSGSSKISGSGSNCQFSPIQLLPPIFSTDRTTITRTKSFKFSTIVHGLGSRVSAASSPCGFLQPVHLLRCHASLGPPVKFH
ncbi:hypothetical protein CY34DRAFT_500187 [Suillus luteus UH-Slu-Lm8-n1]|uniref:Uncharacterized protein n=1 Tax=Suillus luteus UH-Slu-Lm8-n1 TaxID=930992 RepID=A0A0D0BRH4_9AGAM|nr:hypothetical protein CY34DRAFT_500187 [Suillus luteus UH-Slu-Lm8-n1]